MKALLVIDMPKSCFECPMLNKYGDCVLYKGDRGYIGLYTRRPNCPLKPTQVKGNYYAEGYFQNIVDEWLEEIEK